MDGFDSPQDTAFPEHNKNLHVILNSANDALSDSALSEQLDLFTEEQLALIKHFTEDQLHPESAQIQIGINERAAILLDFGNIEIEEPSSIHLQSVLQPNNYGEIERNLVHQSAPDQSVIPFPITSNDCLMAEVVGLMSCASSSSVKVIHDASRGNVVKSK